ncbi:hypothetical protein BG015_008512 [Linnemannia schmuckeri]|uniref:Uncharacterized protein n=1 Tax=Linnemannia schmuckeri TaxID=64567 RepID=A0A9P5VFQ4_9FUNG|nr:hypothetical protein BG015_008512 [Linnemannia schmuckeri]
MRNKSSRLRVTKDPDRGASHTVNVKSAIQEGGQLCKTHATKTLQVGSVHVVHLYQVLQLDIEHLVQQAWPWSLSTNGKLHQQNSTDCLDIFTDIFLYQQLVAYLLNGEQEIGSQYQRHFDAPLRMIPTRHSPAAQQVVPRPSRSLRACERFHQLTYFGPFNAQLGAISIDTTSSRLAAIVVFTAMKGHYLNSIFTADNGAPIRIPAEDHSMWFVFEYNVDEHPYRDFPRPKLAPGFIFLSEEGLFCGLWDDSKCRNLFEIYCKM